MDWGQLTVGLALVLLVGHLFLDCRSLAQKLRRPHGNRFHTGALPIECEHCHAAVRGERELRHEVYWTVAAVVVLIGHIIMDFVQRGG